MKFNIYGRELEYDMAMENYNNIMVNVRAKVKSMEKNFCRDYYNNFSNMDQVVRGIWDYCYDTYIEDIVTWGLGLFTQNGIYSYDKDRFFAEYLRASMQDLQIAVDEVEKKYIAILSDQIEKEEYRRQRKDERNRWSGGGFGVSGAVKGSIEAGALNAASGAAYSIANGVGNFASSVHANREKKALYKSMENVMLYCAGLGMAMENIGEDIVRVLAQNSELKIAGPLEENVQECNSIINNIKQGYIMGAQAVEKAIDVLLLNPYAEDAYKILLDEKKEDQEGTLDTMAQYFGIMLVKEYKDNIIADKLSSIHYYVESEFDNGQKELFDWMNSFHIDTVPYEEMFLKIKKVFKENERTTDENVYSTVEEARCKEEDLKSFIAKISETSGNDVEGINQIITDLEASGIFSCDKYIEYLEGELKLEDERFRNIKGFIYENRDLAERARKEAFLLDEVFSDLSSKEDIEKARKVLELISTDDLKEIYKEYHGLCVQLFEEQDRIAIPDPDEEYGIRRAFADVFYTEYALMRKAHHIKTAKRERDEKYNELYQKYTTINGKCYTPQDADAAYFKILDHSRNYLKYIVEKNSEKRSIFSKIKTGVTGVLCKNYESEYNEFTQNGTCAIPNDDIKQDKKIIREQAKASDDCYNQFKDFVDKKYERIFMSSEIVSREMNADYLFVKTEPVKAEKIYDMLIDICPNVLLEKIRENEIID